EFRESNSYHIDGIIILKDFEMQSTPNRLSKYRCNTTKACDTCRRKKIKCNNVAQSTKCTVCIKHNYECVYSTKPQKRGPKKKDPTNSKDDELFRGLSPEEIKIVSNLWKPEELPLMVDVLTSSSSSPCPNENIP
ncbi:3878_t:CDS:1, partial [Racocetra persica]